MACKRFLAIRASMLGASVVATSMPATSGDEPEDIANAMVPHHSVAIASVPA